MVGRQTARLLTGSTPGIHPFQFQIVKDNAAVLDNSVKVDGGGLCTQSLLGLATPGTYFDPYPCLQTLVPESALGITRYLGATSATFHPKQLTFFPEAVTGRNRRAYRPPSCSFRRHVDGFLGDGHVSAART